MSWLDRLKSGLKKTATALGVSRLDANDFERLEEVLIQADVGYETAAALVQQVRQTRPADIKALKNVLKNEIEQVLAPAAKQIPFDKTRKPFIVLVTGVNGAGKTTTIGKLGAFFKAQGLRVSFVAADTFRAGAVLQLKQWGERTGCPVYTTNQGADAAGLVFDALRQAKAAGDDIVLIDTAGRLQNKVGLMDELKKIRRVIQKVDSSGPHESILVLDATVGQNAVSQVSAFGAAVPLTGLIVTKLDGTAKGGVLLQLNTRFRLPVYAVGVGEGIDDLHAFTAAEFAESLVGDEA